MFKKTEESEWTRFSRALGGAPNASPQPEVAAPAQPTDEPVTVADLGPLETASYDPPSAPPPPSSAAPVETRLPATISSGDSGRSLATGVEPVETIIGEGASIEGTVRSERWIRVRGEVHGEIECMQTVVVEESGRVNARISSENATIGGEVNGSIECTGRLEIIPSGRVTGEISAVTLVIQEGAFFEGQLKMSSIRDGAQVEAQRVRTTQEAAFFESQLNRSRQREDDSAGGETARPTGAAEGWQDPGTRAYNRSTDQ